jgi:hypothetical protein
MNPKYWWLFSFVSMGVIAVLMDFMSHDKFDPDSLPPPAAGTTVVTTRTQNTCEGVIYSISQDGIRYVHESGGGTLLAAEFDNKISFFQLEKFGLPENIDEVAINPETLKKLEYALTNCKARYNPSGVFFALK